MASHLFESIYDNIDGKLDLFLNERLTNMVDVIRGPLAVGLTIYIVLYGYAVMRGVISEPWSELFYRMVKLCILYLAATTVAYSEWITQPLFHSMPDAIAQALAGKTIDSVGAAFDDYYAQADALILRIREEAATYYDINPWKLVLYLVALALNVLAGLSAAIGFAVTVFAKVALAIIIALGPLFIALALFEATRRMFYGWLSQAFNYLVLMGVIIAITSLITDLGETALSQSQGIVDVTVGAALFAAYLILGTIFFLLAPTIASGIAMGAALGVGDFAGNTAAGIGQAARAGRAVGGGASRMLGRGRIASGGSLRAR
ncbi:type IV secretion system protein [Novosphingobium panipatense]|uniref:Type IV secretion system protein VirB6 n=1 Tax=Novosphingobium panipatense TaxID=428991 RepID=A0ABY1QTW0_9SPHN|nr:type IV secretion system protein [Novosphingobium panipatense]SMP80776.1 type IV secretion system protein VirB6 [Novosphingobium panipatense]